MRIMDYNYKQIGQKFYPIIPLVIFNREKSLDSDALIDSGSMLSLFRKDVADELGIMFKSGKPARMASVHGEMLVYVHSLRLVIHDKEFICQTGFSDEFKANVNLLGRMDFFEQFKVTFDEREKKIELLRFE